MLKMTKRLFHIDFLYLFLLKLKCKKDPIDFLKHFSRKLKKKCSYVPGCSIQYHYQIVYLLFVYYVKVVFTSHLIIQSAQFSLRATKL